MIELYDIILQSADAALELLDANTGSMPAGHNGSYYDPETPVRNTSHWLITFLKAYKISGDKKFLAAAHKNIEYLCSGQARPMEVTFWHRCNPHKDTCNGLIGQAWTIEALVTAAVELEMPELIDLAAEVFLLHPFDEKSGMWRCVSVDGTYLDFDYTFNHQLWFAAAGSLIATQQNESVDLQVSCFMDRLNHNLTTYSSGLIRHFVSMKLFSFRAKFYRQLAEPFFNNVKQPIKMLQPNRYMYLKEVGYHSFNLYAFCLLKLQYPKHTFWQSDKFNRVLSFAESEIYWQEVQTSKYGYPYNPPGLEMAFALETFGRDRSTIPNWLEEQMQRSYNFKQQMMNLNTEDSVTYAARLYEATRLSNSTIEL